MVEVAYLKSRSFTPAAALRHYLHGANILSWVLANGGEVFYTPDGIRFSEDSAIEWGTPFCFPQFGKGGEHAGTPPNESKLPVDGFARSIKKWSIVQTGLHEDKRGEFPYVTIEISDTEATRAIWNHSFHLVMDISLEYAAINVSISVKNTGNHAFEYAAALKSHIAVADIEEPASNYVGLEDCIYLDNTLHPTKPRVRFTDESENQEWLELDGKTDRIYLNTDNDTASKLAPVAQYSCATYPQWETSASMIVQFLIPGRKLMKITTDGTRGLRLGLWASSSTWNQM